METRVVGTSESAAGTEVFFWTQSSGMVGLGDLPGGTFESHAKDVSADGLVITGNSVTALGIDGDDAIKECPFSAVICEQWNPQDLARGFRRRRPQMFRWLRKECRPLYLARSCRSSNGARPQW